MKNILLIANISLENKRLVEYASQFCNHYQCKLHILHISKYSEPVLISSKSYYDQNDIEYNNQIESDATKNVAAKISDFIDLELVQVSIKKGNQQQIINSFITDNFIDFIITGNKDILNRSDVTDFRNILVNIVDTPLLFVPELKVFAPYERINFLTAHTDRDIDNIINLSKLFPESIIKVSHKTSSASDTDVRVRNWKQYLSSKIENRIEVLEINENVEDYVKRENLSIAKMSDVFVFTTKKRKFWSRLFDSNTTLSYLAGLEMPSIVFKYSE